MGTKSVSARAAGVVVLTVVVAACARREGVAERQNLEGNSSGDLVERGKYLVTVAACSDCHTPMKMGQNGPEPDMSRFLGGHPQDVKLPPPPAGDGPWLWHGAATNTAFAGPWGVTYAINLTPHAHGMAAWTEDMFIRAMRTGKHMGESRPIQPPMPWPNTGKMTDDDLKAVFAYLKSVPPVNNVVPDYQPPAKR
jgi:mono/diheme cytochrome c family protein